MNTANLKQTIINNLNGLEASHLKEIADYVFFVRQKAIFPEDFQAYFAEVMLQHELEILSQQESLHLEEEFEDYQQKHPEE